MDQRTDQQTGALPAPRILSGDVIRSGEQPAAVVHLSGSELAHLLERAARPIVLRGPESPAPYAAPAGAGGHPGISVTIPGASSGYVLPANVAPLEPVPTSHSWWPVACMVSGCVGLGSGTAAIATGSQGAVAVTAAALAVWGGACFRLVFARES